MPSQRKRIGYLPDKEVHEIIEKICLENNISQSKVTGILVEEALRSRGALKSQYFDFSISENTKIDEFYKNNTQSFQSSSKDELLLNHLNKKNLKDDFQMIHEFIEYKFFKTVMNKYNN